MPISNANSQAMGKKTALSKCEASHGMHLKYLCYNVWDVQNEQEDIAHSKSLLCLADWTKWAKPCPSVPAIEFENAAAMQTINNHPDLFKIITPINIDHFKALLATHPNCPFVESVCKGLREGFWPWANTHHQEYSSTVDEALVMPDDRPEADFLCAQ